MQKITPCLWFDNQAEEAANFYASIFKKSKVKDVSRYDKEGAKVSGRPAGSVMTVSFELEGQEFLGLNGGPIFKFNEAISFTVDCKDQKEVDYYWERLLEGGGKELECGWLKDKYGLAWQIIPTILPELLNDKDSAKAQRAMKAMLKMVKIDVEALKKASKGED